MQRPTADSFLRKVALTAGLGLLLMALLAPFAHFVMFQQIVVPADATATADNILGSEGLFRAGVAAFLIVFILDIVVAWALYALLRPVNENLALLTAWLRVAFAAISIGLLVNLLNAVQMLSDPAYSTLPPGQLPAQMLASIASFSNGWQIALAIFGLDLVGVGCLLFRSAYFPGFLGVLVIIAGGGYLFDSFGTIFVRDYALSVGSFTFVGEALLIPWFLWRAIKGFRSDSGSRCVQLKEVPVARQKIVVQ